MKKYMTKKFTMKAQNYFVLIFLLSISFGYAQCTVDAGEDMTITCGDSIQLHGDRNWHVGFNETPYQASDVFFTNDLIGYTVGEGGTIRKTTDGGTSWLSQTSNASGILRSVYFVNSDFGIVVGDNGTLLRTIDGGINWISQGGVTSEALNAVFFTDANTGFAVGTNGVIIKTTDKGVNWTKKGSITNGLSSVHFPSANVGYALSGNGVYKTINAGESWSILPTIIGNVEQLFFVSETVGYITGRGNVAPGVVYKTIDGGNSWTALNINYAYGTSGIFFLNEMEGYVGTVGKIFKTIDGGKNWFSQHSGFMNLSAIHFPSAKVGYAVGYTTTQAKVTKYTTPDLVTWSPASGLNSSTILNPVASPTVTTTYKVTTTTGTCTAIDSIKITVSKLIADAGADKIITCGNNAQLGVTSNYTGAGTLTYSWSPTTGLNAANIANPVATLEHTTKYYVTVTTPNGCTSKDSVTIFVSALTADAVNKNKGIICGSIVQLDHVQTNYTGPGTLAYSWLPATGLNSAAVANPKADPIATTTYTVTVKIGGCTATDSVLVSVYPLTIDAMNNKTITCGGSAQLDKVITSYVGGGTLTYSWLPATGLSAANIPDPIASPAHTTTYYIKVTSPTGCTVTDSVTVFVNPLVADAGNDYAIICGGSIKLDSVVSNYSGSGVLSYSWSPAIGLNSTTIANPVSNVTLTTKYKVMVTTPNGCTSVDSVAVFVGSLSANAGGNKTLVCKGTAQLDAVTTNYTGAAPLVYSWQPITGLENPHVTNPKATAPGTYTVTLTTVNGCVAQDTIIVNRVEMDAINICMVSIDTAKNLIVWNKPVSNAIDSFYVYRETTVTGSYEKIGNVAYAKNAFKDLTSKPEVKSNKYKISILDACGLESAKSSAHKTMHLSINKGTGITWNLIWEGYEGFPVATYKIYRGTSPTNLVYFDATSGSNTQYTDNNPPLGDVYYQLEIINPNPCDLVNYTRSNVARNNQVGIQELKNTLAFSIYPNPTAGTFTVNVEKKNNAAASLMIYNMLGAIVKTLSLEQNEQEIDVSDLDNGFYTIEVKSANYSGQQKLIIQK
jgi:photosystem II stability/assembly factor-like uncharacterized protein